MKTFELDLDFEQLRQQKETVLELLSNKEFHNILRTNGTNLQGLLHLIDEIQDQAVEIHGYSEEKVFGFEREVDIDEDMVGEWTKC